jgi:hypothetical protein
VNQLFRVNSTTTLFPAGNTPVFVVELTYSCRIKNLIPVAGMSSVRRIFKLNSITHTLLKLACILKVIWGGQKYYPASWLFLWSNKDRSSLR